eukprot:jgi/Mesen1/8552/ME000484S07932
MVSAASKTGSDGKKPPTRHSEGLRAVFSYLPEAFEACFYSAAILSLASAEAARIRTSIQQCDIIAFLDTYATSGQTSCSRHEAHEDKKGAGSEEGGEEAEEVDFMVIRDDLLHPLMGGNKLRKLDALLPLLAAHGVTDAVTCGGCQSAHATAVAVACAQAGITAHLLLRGERPAVLTGYALLSSMMGSVTFVPRSQYAARELMLQEHAAQLAGAGGEVLWLDNLGFRNGGGRAGGGREGAEASVSFGETEQQQPEQEQEQEQKEEQEEGQEYGQGQGQGQGQDQEEEEEVQARAGASALERDGSTGHMEQAASRQQHHEQSRKQRQQQGLPPAPPGGGQASERQGMPEGAAIGGVRQGGSKRRVAVVQEGAGDPAALLGSGLMLRMGGAKASRVTPGGLTSRQPGPLLRIASLRHLLRPGAAGAPPGVVRVPGDHAPEVHRGGQRDRHHRCRARSRHRPSRAQLVHRFSELHLHLSTGADKESAGEGTEHAPGSRGASHGLPAGISSDALPLAWVKRLTPRKFGNILECEVEACQSIAQQTGILLDPIYTLAGWEVACRLAISARAETLRQHTANRRPESRVGHVGAAESVADDSLVVPIESVVLLHTGGTLGLFGLSQRYPTFF